MSDFSQVEPDPPEASFLGTVDSPTPDEDPWTSVTIGPPTDETPPPFEDATTPIGDGQCVVCGAPTWRPAGLTSTGRKKRIPKYCDLHTPGKNISGATASRIESQLQRVQDELADDMKLLGMLTGPMFPVTGYYITEHAEPFTTAVLKLCKNNQRMLRVLHRAAQVAPIYTVAETVAGTAYSVQVDQQKADPHNTIASRLGVERAYNAVYPSSNLGTSPNARTNNNNGYRPPPRYTTVP